MNSMKKRIATALTAATLSLVLAVPALAAEASTIRVSSYKGSTLEMGERSGLIIGPNCTYLPSTTCSVHPPRPFSASAILAPLKEKPPRDVLPGV